MGIPVLIIGKSGSGKSTSLRNFGENEISLINVINKPLPFKQKFTKTVNTDNYEEIRNLLKQSTSNSIVIDDAGYLITNMFMSRHSTSSKGNAVFTLYNDMADEFWKLVECVKTLDDNKIVYFVMHEDRTDYGEIKPKTIGKLLDEKVCIEGIFTIVLRAMSINNRYVFKTRTDGMDVTKTPIDMFDSLEIDNDLRYVDTKIREYYGT